MSSKSEWLDEEKQVNYCDLLEVRRESGDGESKESSPHTSASEDDNQETKQALIDVNRKLERRKDKKISKIPVRQAKVSYHADVCKSPYDNGCHSDQLDNLKSADISYELPLRISDKSDLDSVKSGIETKTITNNDFNDANYNWDLQMLDYNNGKSVFTTNNVCSNESDTFNKEKKKENNLKALANSWSPNIKLDLEYKQALEQGKLDIQEHETLEKNNMSLESINSFSLNPQMVEYLQTPTTPTLAENLNHPILEAPEEFRTLQENNNCLDECLNDAIKPKHTLNEQFESGYNKMPVHISHTNLSEPKQCCIVASVRDADKANPPETDNVCGLELNKDTMKSTGLPIEANNFNIGKSNLIDICNVNEAQNCVGMSLQRIDANERLKFAAPSKTITGMHNIEDCRIFTDINGGEIKDNDQMKCDGLNITETKQNVELTTFASCKDSVNDVSSRHVQKDTEEPTSTADSDTVEKFVTSETECMELAKNYNGNADNVVVECDTLTDYVNEINCKNFNKSDVTVLNVKTTCINNYSSKGHEYVNELNSTVSNIGAYACAGNEQTPATAETSIAIGVARCAQAPRCSRISASRLCAVSSDDSSISYDFSNNFTELSSNVTEKHSSSIYDGHNYTKDSEPEHNNDYTIIENDCGNNNDNNIDNFSANYKTDFSEHNKQFYDTDSHLVWGFKNGRLVFNSSIDTENERASIKLPQENSGPIQVSQCHSKDTSAFTHETVIESTNKNESSITEISPNPENDSDELEDVLSSRDLNRRVVEGRSWLKHLENKLKEAGITDKKLSSKDGSNDNESEATDFKYKCENNTEQDKLETITNKEEIKQVVDKLALTLENKNLSFGGNENYINEEIKYNADLNCENEIVTENTDQNLFSSGSFCQFDVREVGSFSGLTDNEFYVVYDELEGCSSDEDECEREYYHIISKMRGDNSMGTDGDRAKQHNPDRENLKSLLKKPGRGRDSKKNRVVFNENKNEFFDADYIILIREECDYDDEEDDGVCTCNEHEMVRLTCCEPNCNCNLYESYNDPTPQSPKFAPPLEFVDAVTLSPPEGYKDMELGEQQLLALQMARRSQRTTVCRDCSATHEEDDGKIFKKYYLHNTCILSFDLALRTNLYIFFNPILTVICITDSLFT